MNKSKYSKCLRSTLEEALERIEIECNADGPLATILDAMPARDKARRIRDLNRRATRCHEQLQLLLEEEKGQ